jgi:molybdenum cofactor synthesis domain-containing protein
MKFAVLTISDRSASGEREDVSGPVLVNLVRERGWEVVRTKILPDEEQEIEAALRELADTEAAQVILTTGGTGFSPRDRTPEATRSVLDRSAPGFAEIMRLESYKKTPHAMLSRGIAGIRGRTLIINLPGSPKAVRENFDVIAQTLPHAVQLLLEDPEAEGGHQISASRRSS